MDQLSNVNLQYGTALRPSKRKIITVRRELHLETSNPSSQVFAVWISEGQDLKIKAKLFFSTDLANSTEQRETCAYL